MYFLKSKNYIHSYAIQISIAQDLDSNIESKSLNNTYLNVIEIFFFFLKNIEFKNLVVTST